MMSAPNPLLVTKMTRIALQILSTAEPRSKVTSPAAELVLETISSASPKVRRELLDDHLEALDWILKDAFRSQAPTATFSTEPEPAGGKNLSPAPDDWIAYRERAQAVLAAARRVMPEALAHAFNWGYLAGEADGNPRPASAEFADLANPFMNVRGDFTP